MSTPADTKGKSRQTIRIAVIAAALGVAGMFTAAATFAETSSSVAVSSSAAQDERG